MMNVIEKYVRDNEGLVQEIKESSDLQNAEAFAFGHDMVIFLFGRLFRYFKFDTIFIKHEQAGDLDAIVWINDHELLLEFEVTSEQFDHDQEKCNIIVCWEHNWKNVPTNIDVVELKYFWEKAKI